MNCVASYLQILLILAFGVAAANAEDAQTEEVIMLNIFDAVVPIPARYVIQADRLNERVEIQLSSLAASDGEKYKAGIIKIGKLEDDREGDDWFEANAYRKARCADLSLFSAKAGEKQMHWFRGKEKYLFLTDDDPHMAERIWSYLLSQKPDRLSCSESGKHNNTPQPTQ